VRGKGKIEIKKDGSVNGDLTTAQIVIEDGILHPSWACSQLAICHIAARRSGVRISFLSCAAP